MRSSQSSLLNNNNGMKPQSAAAPQGMLDSSLRQSHQLESGMMMGSSVGTANKNMMNSFRNGPIK
jgi:hypothetical protein